MRDLSDWLESCFDAEDYHAPVRAFVFGAVTTSIAAAISSLAVDPGDWKMLAALLTGAIFLGGGCAAMFALPPEKFGRLCWHAFELFGFVPLTIVGGVGAAFGLLAFSLFVSILAALAALHVCYLVARSLLARLAPR